MAQAEGRRVGGRYHLVEQIGRGGMGVVWRAHDELLDREVAVKEVRFDSAMGGELNDLNRRTMREARAAGRLTHPNVVVVHDVIEEDGRPWIVMQFVPSRSLGQVIREDGPLSPERTAEIGLQILDALRAAHRQGVLHRDVKPENVLLAEDGRVVLTDFGIARIEADSTMTRTGLVGTPAFIPPERLRGYPAQRESDLWSLGATLYAAVEGKAPHDRGLAMATMHAILNDEPTPPKRAGRLGPVLTRLLAKEPADRPGYDEITRLLRQATRPAVKPAAPASDSTVRIGDVSASAAKPAAAEKPAGVSKAAGGGSGGAPRAGGRPYASPAKRPPVGEDDRGAATQRHPDAKPSAPAAGTAAAGHGEKTPPHEATGTAATGKDAPSKGPAEPATPPSAADRVGSETAGDVGTAGEVTSPLPAMGADGLPAREAAAAAGDDQAPRQETTETAAPASRGQAPSDTDPGDGKADETAVPDEPGTPGEAHGAAKRPEGTARTHRATPVIPETGAQAAPALTGPKRSPASKVTRDVAGSAQTPGQQALKPAGSTPGGGAAGAAPAASPLAGLKPAPAEGGAAVPTQRSAVWPEDASTRGAQPIPVLKLTLALIPVLVVIAVVAGYLGMRDAERSAGPVGSGAATAEGSPSGKPKKSPTGEASQPAVAAATSSPDREDDAVPESAESPTPSPSTSQPADVPEGWYRYKDRTGFSVALPNGWKVSERRATQVWFRGPGTPGALLIDQTNSPKKDAEKDWKQQEPYQKVNFPGYKRVKIVSVDYWKEAADWEFTYNGRSGRMHVINRGFVTDKRHGYAIYWTTLDSRWEQDYHYFETFTATFKPAK